MTVNTNLLAAYQTPAAPAPGMTATSSSSSTASSSTATATSALADTYNTFLTLLTTQMQNQDPLDPTDSSQFTQQLVSYSEVEQQINTNSELNTIISNTNSNNLNNVVGYLGNDAEVSGNTLPLSNGVGQFSYSFSQVPANATIQITDSNGNVVSSSAATPTVGKHDVVWNGTDSSGNQLADGTYTVNVIATAANGSAITPTLTTFAPITGVQTGSGGAITFTSGNLSFTPSQILSLSVPATLNNTSNALNTTTSSTGTGSSSG